jgi:hypothetical protein
LRLAWASLILAILGPAVGILSLGLWIVVFWRPLSREAFVAFEQAEALAALGAVFLGGLALGQMQPDQRRRGGRQIAIEGISVGVVTLFYLLILLLRLRPLS